MKTGNSDTFPSLMSHSAGLLQIDYDVIERTREESGQKTYDYKYVEFDSIPTRSQLIDAFIGNIYSKDAEIALINNEILTPGTEQYKEYTTVREHAKQLVKEVFPQLPN